MRPLLTLLIMLSALSQAFGQIVTETSQLAEFYVTTILLGPGIESANIRHTGMIGGLGQFEAPVEILGVTSGLILTTGHADSIGHPNTHDSYTSHGNYLPGDRGWIRRGDRDLNKLARSRTNDITVIEFDFVPVNNVLEFRYVFASDEYPEYANSVYNDVFAFFLSGPGIKKKRNLAVLPGGETIAINHVNHKKNTEYYRGNPRKPRFFRKLLMSKTEREQAAFLRKNLEFDGLTTVLTVHCDVVPYKKYHMKIAIGDVGDNTYDSGVFLEAGSFVSVADTSGKYYEKLAEYAGTTPNIDSILGTDMPDPVVAELPVEHPEFELMDIYFDVNSFQLSDSSRLQLDLFAAYLLQLPALNCSLYGFTDNTGSRKYNQQLSELRAKSVIDYLVLKGVNASRLKYTGFGVEHPRSDNSTEKARSQNRRVEIELEE
jgi:outer membrane protein OmpA-like peptidoglycan-associated protein